MSFTYNQPITYNSPIPYNYAANATLRSISIGCRISCKSNYTLTVQSRINKKKTFTAQSRISNRTYRTITSQARIANRTYHTITSQAKIASRTYRAIGIQARLRSFLYNVSIQAHILRGKLTLQARISRRQGYPVIGPDNPAYSGFTATQLSLRSYIKNTVVHTAQTVLLGCYISPKKQKSISCQARIGHGHQISIQARIRPRIVTGIIPCTFNIQNTMTGILQFNFDVNTGLLSGQSISSRVYISRPVRKKIFCHFTIPASLATGVTDTISVSGTARGGQVLGAKCYIS